MTVSIWRQLNGTPRLQDGEIHLYRMGLAGETSQYQPVLSADELARAERLLDLTKRQLFIVCRGRLRQILSQYLKISAQDITFRYNDTGKPSLTLDHHCDLVFNLSHSADCAVIAVTRGTDIGVDIEKIDPALEFHKLAERFLDRDEQLVLQRTPAPRKRRMFYRLWTAKESRLKMAGTGFTQSSSQEVAAGSLFHFYVFPGFVATIAGSEEITAIKKYKFSG